MDDDKVPSKECKRRKINTFTDTKEIMSHKNSVQTEGKEKSKSRFMSDFKKSDSEKESLLEKESVYASQCVEFLDTIDFDDDKLCDATLHYIDSIM